jgi:hypothetical protein
MHLQAINYSSYKQPFSAQQQARMAALFPTGVCDSPSWSRAVPIKGTYRAIEST